MMPPMLLTGAGRACCNNQPSGPTEGEILAAGAGGGFLFLLAQGLNAEQMAAAMASNMVFN